MKILYKPEMSSVKLLDNGFSALCGSDDLGSLRQKAIFNGKLLTEIQLDLYSTCNFLIGCLAIPTILHASVM